MSTTKKGLLLGRGGQAVMTVKGTGVAIEVKPYQGWRSDEVTFDISDLEEAARSCRRVASESASRRPLLV